MNGMHPQDQLNNRWNGQRGPEQPTADAPNGSFGAAHPGFQQSGSQQAAPPAQPGRSDQLPVQPVPPAGMPVHLGQSMQSAHPGHPVPPVHPGQPGMMPVSAQSQACGSGAPAGVPASVTGQSHPVYGYPSGPAAPTARRPEAAGAAPSAAASANGATDRSPAGPAAAQHTIGGSGAPEKGPRRRVGRWIAIGALMLACILGGGAAGGLLVMQAMRTPETADRGVRQTAYTASADPTPTSASSNAGAGAKTASAAGALSVEDIAAKAAPSVVAISTEARVQDMFGRIGYAEGAGSGVIISKDGYIVTNHHVVNGARNISVTLATGDRYDAELIGSDASNDIAVIRIQATDLPAIEVASSSELKLGSTVVAIGNPLGVLEGTVTDGIISATSRNIQTEDGVMYNVLQTNAAINHGNSGGALVNNRGQLVGINSNKATGNSVEGIAFAIPSDTVMPLVNQLIENGEVRTPEIGIVAASITRDMQQAYKLPAGIYVQSVQSGSPAEKAGLKERDIITRVDGQSIGTLQDFTALKNRHQTGDTIKLTVQRGSETVSLDVVLEGSGA